MINGVIVVCLLATIFGDVHCVQEYRNPSVGKIYTYDHSINRNFNESLAFCEKLGLRLVMPKTGAEVEWIIENIQPRVATWIGAIPKTNQLPDTWLDGTPITNARYPTDRVQPSGSGGCQAMYMEDKYHPPYFYSGYYGSFDNCYLRNTLRALCEDIPYFDVHDLLKYITRKLI